MMFQFTKDCIIGVELLDREHRHLFELMNSIVDMINNQYIPDRYSQIKELLQELEDYAEQHFSDEEAYMEKIGYPELAKQKKAHEAFVERLAEIDLDSDG